MGGSHGGAGARRGGLAGFLRRAPRPLQYLPGWAPACHSPGGCSSPLTELPLRLHSLPTYHVVQLDGVEMGWEAPWRWRESTFEWASDWDTGGPPPSLAFNAPPLGNLKVRLSF